MLIPNLAIKNLLGAGLRTWLNVFVLSLSFVAIIGMQGLYEGMNRQASTALMQSEYGGGQYWQKDYDPYDPLTFEDSHGELPAALADQVTAGNALPVLVTQATAYPNGRLLTVMIKGVLPEQDVLDFPTKALLGSDSDLPVMIGSRMAKNAKLAIGDLVTVRWRDANGVFDAVDAEIVHIFKTTVSSIDVGQMWVPLDVLQQNMQMPGHATLVVVKPGLELNDNYNNWSFKSLDFLLADIKALVKSKSAGASFLYAMLMFLAMLAIFDTQVLSIVRRRKEIGMLIAMGMTRNRVIRLFTVEGAMHGVFAALFALLYGGPLLTWFSRVGWKLPDYSDDFGIAISERLFPVYTIGLVAGTVLIVLITTTIISFLPTRRISKMKPTDALRGKRI